MTPCQDGASAKRAVQLLCERIGHEWNSWYDEGKLEVRQCRTCGVIEDRRKRTQRK